MKANMPNSERRAPAPRYKLDQIDNAILDLLTKNGRMSNREIARELDIVEGTVRQRLKKLLDSKAARIALVTDVGAVGVGASAILLIRTLPHLTRTVAEQLAAIEACKFVGLSFGEWDMSAMISSASRSELAQIMTQHVNNIEGITQMTVREPVGWGKLRHDLVHIA